MEDRSIKMTNYWIVYKIEGDKYLNYFDDRDSMLEKASYWKAFDDCCDLVIIEVKEGDTTWHYSGWEPGMVYHWWNDKGIEWETRHKGWDH